jgi:hypothetical protein
MSALQLTDEQVIELVKQLPDVQRQILYEYLVNRQRSSWDSLSDYFEDGARIAAAKRGRDWDTMSDEERLDFVDDLVHEDRECNS